MKVRKWTIRIGDAPEGFGVGLTADGPWPERDERKIKVIEAMPVLEMMERLAIVLSGYKVYPMPHPGPVGNRAWELLQEFEEFKKELGE